MDSVLFQSDVSETFFNDSDSCSEISMTLSISSSLSTLHNHSIPILTSDNWTTWSKGIRTLLTANKLIHHIDTETGILSLLASDFEPTRPMSPSFLSTTPTTPAALLIQEDALVRSLIYQHIDDYAMETILCAESARDLYLSLKSLYKLQLDDLLSNFFLHFKTKAEKGALVRDVAHQLDLLQQRIAMVDVSERPADFLKLMVLLHMFDSEMHALGKVIAQIRERGPDVAWDEAVRLLRDEQAKCHQRRRSNSLKQQLWTFDQPCFPPAPKVCAAPPGRSMTV